MDGGCHHGGVLPGVRLKDEPAQPGRQGPLFPSSAGDVGNTVVRRGQEALHRGKPRCWGGVLVLHPEQPALAPTFQGMEGTGFSSDASDTEHQLYTGKQNRLRGKRSALSGDAVFSECPSGSSSSWLPHSRAGGSLGSGGGLVLPPPTTSSPATHSSAGTGRLGGFSSSSERGLCHLSVRMRREGI